MRIRAPLMFELRRDESFTIHIESEGGAYIALGEVNGFPLHFDEQTPQAEITPAILAGPRSANRIHLHLVYPLDEPPQRYRVTVVDESGEIKDTVNSTFNPDRPRPYRVDVDLVALVQ
jgi:hypothetical protein